MVVRFTRIILFLILLIMIHISISWRNSIYVGVYLDIKNEQIAIMKSAFYNLIKDRISRKSFSNNIKDYRESFEYVDFSNILQCDVLENNTTVMSGGIGRAIVGGVLAGGAGAVVGAVTRKSKEIVNHLEVRVITNDIVNSLIKINVISSEIKRDSTEYLKGYEFSQEIYALMSSVIAHNESNI